MSAASDALNRAAANARFADAIAMAQAGMATQPQVRVRGQGGNARRFAPGQVVVLVDDLGPCPLKIESVSSMAVRLVPLTKSERDDFLLRVRAVETARRVAAEMTPGEQEALAERDQLPSEGVGRGHGGGGTPERGPEAALPEVVAVAADSNACRAGAEGDAVG